MIQDKYIDWQRATIKAIKDYEDMRFILANYESQRNDIDDRMTKPGGSNVNRQPVSGGGDKTEESWAYFIDQIVDLESNYSKAKEFISWFTPAWERLSDREKIILEEQYMIERLSGSWEMSAMERLHVERAEIFRLRRRALARLSVLLYGPR